VSYTLPLAPSGVTTTPNGAEASIGLAWSQTNNSVTVSSWQVDRSADGGANWVKQATVSVMSYTDYSPAAGVSYQYRIQAIGSNGVLSPSSAVTAAVTWNDWVFRPVDGSALVTFAGGPARAPWTQQQAITEAETQSAYRREYVGPYQARRVDLSATFGLSSETPYQTRERLRAMALNRTEGWLKSPSGDVMRGRLRDLSGEINTATKWESLRLQFVEQRGVS
jgi:hypothetical protein